MLRSIAVMLILAVLPGCGISRSIDNAVAVLDRGIEDISTESANWQTILQRVASELPDDISEVIRNDAQNLATRSIATAGVEFRCNVDFLAGRAKASLQRLKAKLRGKNPPILPPAFCQVSPDAVDLNADAESWAKIAVYGYDLDHSDTSGKPLTFFLIDSSGAQQPIPEDRIGRTTHYQVTLNLGGMAKNLHVKGVSKIVASWNESTNKLPQVIVLPWQPERRSERVNVGRTDLIPKKVGRGDADFNTHDDEHMSVVVRGVFEIREFDILSRVFMHAKEERHDWTEVREWSLPAAVYKAPKGWKIVEVRPRANSRHTANITTHDAQSYSRPAGEIVSTFQVWGDRNGDEAGTWTRVRVHWRAIEIDLEQTTPEWAH
ncbi:hypothetical protein KR51_00025530 [Rubidibacter lacunae KORDI 51-2]|uniref:Uncharacterized protein n=1 Tax=Rubidibacter lacunae KORDI 51-2 TaxID=582515 RepID=U5DMH3_9CHRO|nr:hypothetical protein [Rubidibacter lacunae]ERN40905.1 hypothetical protein KR51_00025530 [Rubidibacter lacunae KORDI 51-2]